MQLLCQLLCVARNDLCRKESILSYSSETRLNRTKTMTNDVYRTYFHVIVV